MEICLIGLVLCVLPYRRSIQNQCCDLPKSVLCTFQWRNRTEHNFQSNLLAIITLDRSDGFQSDKVHFKAQILLQTTNEGHVPAILNSGKNYLSKGVNILLGQPVLEKLQSEMNVIFDFCETYSLCLIQTVRFEERFQEQKNLTSHSWLSSYECDLFCREKTTRVQPC